MLSLLRLYARLPLSVIHALGAALGLLALLAPGFRRTIAGNLATAGLSASGRVRRVAMELGKEIAELPAIWLRPVAEATAWVRQVDGWEQVEAARAAGKGILMLGPHLGGLELAGLYIAERLPITVLYRRLRQDWAHELMLIGRQRAHGQPVEATLAGVRALFAALKRNQAAWILPDQYVHKGEGHWAPFLGDWTHMPTLLYKMHEKTGAALILFVCERLPRGRGFRLRFETLPPPPADLDLAMRQVNAALEAKIHALPDQYLWSYQLHRRSRHNPAPEGPAR